MTRVAAGSSSSRHEGRAGGIPPPRSLGALDSGVLVRSAPMEGELGRTVDGGDLVRGDDGKKRCWWGASAPDYLLYHDREWGFPVADDHRLFEKICLEGFQA